MRGGGGRSQNGVLAVEAPCVGRDAELEAVAEAVRALERDGEAAIIEVAGEPGMGKTRLLRELAAVAAAHGHLVLTGRAAAFEADLPFGVFVDAIDDWLQDSDRDRLLALAGDEVDHAAIVLPAYRAVVAAARPRVQQERYRAYRAVRHLLSAMAAEIPVVLVLDDLHWADPGSVELLCHLLAHPPRGPVLLALAMRPAQVPSPLRAALAAAVQDIDAQRLNLAPLERSVVGDVVGRDLSAETLDRLYEESGGNPLFLLQLARSSYAGRGAPSGAGQPTGVPEPVMAALATELVSLPEPTRALLEGAAVAGDPFALSHAAIAADLSEPSAIDQLEDLVRFRLLSPTAVPGQLGFRHPIVRSTVYELTTPSWRAAAHGRLAAFLAASGSGSSVLAPHVERSAQVGDDAAVSTLIDAASAEERRAPLLAARWYGAALRLLPVGPDTEVRRVELMIAMATALAGAGHLEESKRTLGELLERLPAEKAPRVPVVAFCAGVEHLLGRHRDADDRVLGELSNLPEPASLAAAQLMAELAAGSGYQNRKQDMIRWAQETLDVATRRGDRPLAAVGAGQVALAQYFLGRPADAAMDRAAAAFDALDDAGVALRLDLGLWIGWTEAVLERYEQALAHCQRIIDVSRATGQGSTLLVTMTAQAWTLIRLGRLTEADHVLAGALESGYLAPNIFLSVAVGQSALVATAQGRYRAAVRAGEEATRLARPADPGLIPGMSGLYHALPLIEMGHPDRARKVLLAMNGGGHELQTSRSGYAAACEVLTRAELGLGNLDAAESWAARAEDAWTAALPAEAASARRATAAVLVERGEPGLAAEMALDAAEAATAAGLPIEAGRCSILGARALARHDQRDHAVEVLQRARADLGRIGADGYRSQAERELRRLGHQVPAPAVDILVQAARRLPDTSHEALAALTRREREVVALVAVGYTNPEVAEQMYLSRHTVKRHLSNAMTKLDVHSRRQLRALFPRRDGNASRLKMPS